jgi:hypothetical protein
MEEYMASGILHTDNIIPIDHLRIDRAERRIRIRGDYPLILIEGPEPPGRRRQGAQGCIASFLVAACRGEAA